MWVMTVVTYRTCIRGETTYQAYEEVPVDDRVDNVLVAPPQYIEKAPVEEAVKEVEKVAPAS
jgi:hypothetical protein